VHTDRAGGGGLCSPQPGVIELCPTGGQQQPAVGVELGEDDTGVSAPADRFQGEVPGVPEDHDPPHGALRPGQAAGAAMLAESVDQDEVAAGDGDGQSEAVQNEDSFVRAISGVGDTHGGCHTNPRVTAVA